MRLQSVVSVLGPLTFLWGLGFSHATYAQAVVIKVGTEVSKASPWGKVFEAWARDAKEKSADKMELQVIYGAEGGDAARIVALVKSGVYDAAAVSGAGLVNV
jgi:TRAP-type C4-dicarboxylate transport system substrate-binding protein